jgi:hypothetical protein
MRTQFNRLTPASSALAEIVSPAFINRGTYADATP